MIAKGRSPPVLPNNGIINRQAGFPVPNNGGFALVGDAYCADIIAIDTESSNSLGGNPGLRRPYFIRIMLHPSRLRKYLGKLLLRYRAYLPAMVKNNCPRTGCALV